VGEAVGLIVMLFAMRRSRTPLMRARTEAHFRRLSIEQ